MKAKEDSLGWNRSFRRVFLPVLLAGGSLFASGDGSPPPGANSEPPAIGTERSEEDVWIFALRLDQTTLSQGFPAFPRKEGFLLPLGELCRLLDLAVQVDPARGVAEGFVVEEARRFRLDVRAGTVDIQGIRGTFDAAQIELHADDIYVESGLLATWLPLNLEIRKRMATVQVVPREPLPLQLRWARAREPGGLGVETKVPSYPRLADPYRTFETPIVDESLRLTSPSQAELKGRVHAQSTTLATGDFLGLSSSLYAVLNAQGGLSEFWMTMGRRDPHAELLGGLHATEFAFGEVLNPGLEMVVQPFTGTGALLTNFPLQRENAFDRHSFQGDLAPGWQVELYRNQALLAFQASRPDGRFEFLNVNLYYGLNEFRLMFYGPQGQRREEVARFDVSESQTPKGAFQYRLVGVNPSSGGSRAQLEGRYGISKRMAASFAVARVAFAGQQHTYTEAGVQGFWKPLSAAFTAANDSQGGTAEELSLRTRIGALGLNLKRTELQGGFSSEVFNPLYGLMLSRTSIEASALLSSGQRSWFTMDFGASQDRLAAGGRVERFYNRLSSSIHGYFIANELNRSVVRGGDTAFPPTTTGDLLVSKFFPNFSLRAQANYQVNHGSKLNGYAVMVETPRFPQYVVRASILRTLSTGETIFLVGANKSQGTFSLGLDVSYSTHNRFLVDLTYRVGLVRNPRNGRFTAQAQGLASQGALSVRTFLDVNANGKQDPGEKDVERVGFVVNGASHPGITDAKGVALLTSLTPDQDANLAVVANTLEDPLMRPSIPGVRFTPRPGHSVLVDFPLVLVGEVNGTVYRKNQDQVQELPGLAVELVALDGKVTHSVRTAYDGFYTLPEIAPGRYLLRIPEAELRRLGLALVPPKDVRISSDGTVIDGLNFLLVPIPVTKVKP